MRNTLIVVCAVLVILAGGWWYFAHLNTEVVEEIETVEPVATHEEGSNTGSQGAAIGDENLVTFKCSGSKTITAVFERDIVGLTLSDGRQITLRQAVSGSGIRYLSNDQKIEFRGKGMEGYLVEDGATTFANCTASN